MEALQIRMRIIESRVSLPNDTEMIRDIYIIHVHKYKRLAFGQLGPNVWKSFLFKNVILFHHFIGVNVLWKFEHDHQFLTNHIKPGDAPNQFYNEMTPGPSVEIAKFHDRFALQF